jgi:hypothetical protein
MSTLQACQKVKRGWGYSWVAHLRDTRPLRTHRANGGGKERKGDRERTRERESLEERDQSFGNGGRAGHEIRQGCRVWQQIRVGTKVPTVTKHRAATCDRYSETQPPIANPRARRPLLQIRSSNGRQRAAATTPCIQVARLHGDTDAPSLSVIRMSIGSVTNLATRLLPMSTGTRARWYASSVTVSAYATDTAAEASTQD